MIKIFALGLLLFSTSSFSQLRPTGGGDVDELDLPLIITNETKGAGSFDQDFLNRNKSPEIRFMALNLQISENDILCKGNRLEFAKNIVETYHILSLMKANSIHKEQCDQNAIYLKCLYSNSVKGIITAIANDKKNSMHYLKKTYDLDKKSAKKIINFFIKLEEI